MDLDPIVAEDEQMALSNVDIGERICLGCPTKLVDPEATHRYLAPISGSDPPRI